MWADEGLLEGKAGEKGRRTDGVIEGRTDEGMEGQTDEGMEGRTDGGINRDRLMEVFKKDGLTRKRRTK